MRRGSTNLFELTPTLVFAAIMALVFFGLNFYLFTIQERVPWAQESSLVTVTGNRIDDFTANTAEVRGTSRLPHLLLTSRYATGPDITVREKLQDYLYCTAHGIGGCSFDQSRFRDVADSVIGRPYRINVQYRGESVSIDNLAGSGPPPEGPTTYILQIPAPGGERMEFKLLVNGEPQSLRWTN